MAYDEGLAERVRNYLVDQKNVVEKKMFGGLCFMVSNHMCCGIMHNKLMARVGADDYEKHIQNKFTSPMDFTGRPLKGMIYVDLAGLHSDEDLKEWIEICLDFVKSLPPKK